jgi:hypothetical protein
MGINAEDCCFETHYARREDSDTTTAGHIKLYYLFSVVAVSLDVLLRSQVLYCIVGLDADVVFE